MNGWRFGGPKEFLSQLQLKNTLNKYKKQLSIFLIALIAISSFAVMQHRKNVQHEVYTRAFNVAVEGNSIGVIRDKEKVNGIITSIQDQLSKDYDMEIAIGEAIVFEDTHVEDEELTSLDKLEEKIKANLSFNVWGYELLVDGEAVGVLKSQDQAEGVLAEIKQPYVENVKEGTEIKDIKFVEEVKIEKKQVPFSEIQSSEKVLAFLQKGTNEEKTHVVAEGESFWTIANKYNLSVEELISANLDKDSELIHPGDELSLIVPKPYISVATFEKQKFIEDVKYDTKIEYSSSMYKDEERVKKKGIPGQSEVIAEVEKHNGIEVARVVLQETLISEPVAQVVVQGTKEPPPSKGLGTFIHPLATATLTSRFGSRWGRIHEGIDLSAKTGTAIKAADGGIVTYAGWKSGYGYMVEIDHGAGFKTRYAHSSKLYVKKGDKVYQGKTIAAVGNTGRSTGPHLHFEVLKYGEPQNPYNYIGKKYD